MRRIIQIATSSCYDSETGQEEFTMVALAADGSLWWTDRLTAPDDHKDGSVIWMAVPPLPDHPS